MYTQNLDFPHSRDCTCPVPRRQPATVAVFNLNVYTGGVTDTPTYGEEIAANVRAERVRAGLKQADCAHRMQALGFEWHTQTVSNVERGGRRLTAEEILGLALALEVPMSRLMRPDGHSEFVRLPAGQEIRTMTVVRSVLFHLNDESVRWDGDKPVPGEPAEGVRDDAPWRVALDVFNATSGR